MSARDWAGARLSPVDVFKDNLIIYFQIAEDIQV